MKFTEQGIPDVWVMNSDGSNATNITAGNCSTYFCYNPSWSPDGTKIVVQSHAKDGTTGWSSGSEDIQREIYVVNADGSNFIRLTERESPCAPRDFPKNGVTTLNNCWSNEEPHWGPAAP